MRISFRLARSSNGDDICGCVALTRLSSNAYFSIQTYSAITPLKSPAGLAEPTLLLFACRIGPGQLLRDLKRLPLRFLAGGLWTRKLLGSIAGGWGSRETWDFPRREFVFRIK